MGTRKWADIKASVPESPGREARVAQARAELEAEIRAYNLTELRKLVTSATQEELAEALDMNQSAVSKTERADDMTVSRLRSTVEALGGTLTLVATFDDKPVVLALGRAKPPTPPAWVAAAQRWAADSATRSA
jgi:transcriptional regulator with XRE-family HTH domain